MKRLKGLTTNDYDDTAVPREKDAKMVTTIQHKLMDSKSLNKVVHRDEPSPLLAAWQPHTGHWPVLMMMMMMMMTG